jgi:hypothetical protein
VEAGTNLESDEMNKTYVEFFYPGSFVSETSTREVADRSPITDIPKGAYGYRFYSQSEVVIDGETLTGPIKERSGMIYFGEVMSLVDVSKLPRTEILQSNMRCNHWETVVRTVRGNFQNLNEGDQVLAPLPSMKSA